MTPTSKSDRARFAGLALAVLVTCFVAAQARVLGLAPVWQGYCMYVIPSHQNPYYVRTSGALQYGEYSYLVDWGNSCAGVAAFSPQRLPDSAVVADVRFVFNQTAGDTWWVIATCLGIDPRSGSAEEVYRAVVSGQQYCDPETSSIGWNDCRFSTSGVEALLEYLKNEVTTVGLRTSGPSGLMREQGRASPCSLLIRYWLPGDPDVAVLGMELLTYPLLAGETDTVAATITNIRQPSAHDFYVYALRNGEKSDSVLIGSLAQAETTRVLLAINNPPGDTGFTQLCCVSADTTDGWVENDSAWLDAHTYWVQEAPTEASLSVSCSVIPNPARSGEAVRIRCAAREPGRLSVYDAVGRSVWSAFVPRTQAADTRPLVLPRLAAGVYLVRLESGSQAATAKLVIQP